MSTGGLVEMVIIMAAVLAPVVVVYGIVDLRRWHRRKAMPEIEELRKLVEEELGEAGKIDEHGHIPTIVATIRLVGERIVAMEQRISDLEKQVKQLQQG